MGYDLALELRFKANEYHIKSDNHVILFYEAATVENEVKDLINGTEVPEHLKKSTLLSLWGRSLAPQIPDIAKQVRAFHDVYKKARKNRTKTKERK